MDTTVSAGMHGSRVAFAIMILGYGINSPIVESNWFLTTMVSVGILAESGYALVKHYGITE